MEADRELSQIINQIIDAALAAIILGAFGLFIYSRIKKISFGEALKQIIGSSETIKPKIRRPTTWQQKTI